MYENPLASLRDEVGAQHRLLLEPTLAFISGARGLPEGAERRRQQPQPPQAAPAAAAGALIDLGSSGEVDDGSLESRRDGSRLQGGPSDAQQRAPGVSAPPVPLLQPRFSENPFQAPSAPPSEFDDAASAARLNFGASASLARTSHHSHHSSAAAAAVPGGRSRLRIATRRGGAAGAPASVADDGESSQQSGTPNSSCYHDSVYTFRMLPGAPGSVAGSEARSVASSARGGGAGRRPRRAGGEGRRGLASAPERRDEGGDGGDEDGAAEGRLSLSRTSWASQDLLVSVPSSAPIDPR